MLVFWRQRLVFLATPKTGSTAVEAALAEVAAVTVLRPPHLKHTNMARYHRVVRPFITDDSARDFDVCALMREPVDWLGSWYRYRQRPEEVPEKSTRELSFDEFVTAYCAKDQPEFARIGNQARFLAPKPELRASHIFRYDRMGDFTDFLSHRLGMAVTLPRVNVSPAADTRLSAETLARLKDHCARDFALYDSLA